MRVTCDCGHEKTAHLHYRGGSDCSICGVEGCPSYVADTVIGHLLAAVTRRGTVTPPVPSQPHPVDSRTGAA